MLFTQFISLLSLNLSLLLLICCMGFPGGSDDKSLPAMQETQVRALGREDPWRRERKSTPVFLPGQFHGKMSLVGYTQSTWSQRVKQD